MYLLCDIKQSKKMKTQNNLLKIISRITNITWYLNMLYIVVMLIVFIIGFWIKDPVGIQLATVKFKMAPHEIALKPIETKASSAAAIAKEAEIGIRMWITPMIYIAFLLLAAFFATISTGIIYHLRKIFAAIKQQQPFRADVVKSLKIIALLLALITPLHLLYGGISYYVLTHTIADFNKQFMMVWSENFIGPILGAVIYIIADILKYGIELKKENEEFV